MGVTWPRSKITQAIIAIAHRRYSASEAARFAMKSFNNFYFGPRKPYPYPYADAHSANLALVRDCSLAFVSAFIGAFTLQQLLATRKPN
jgi:hypothetical protein